jgi:hypothetical protein
VVTIRKRPASGNKTFYYAEVEAIEAIADGDAAGPVDGDAQPATESVISPVAGPTAVVAPPSASVASAAASSASPAGWMSAAAALAIPGVAPGEAVE